MSLQCLQCLVEALYHLSIEDVSSGIPSIWQAIKMVHENKMGYLKTAREFVFPGTTLFFYLVNSNEEEDAATATTLYGKTILPPELKRDLVDYCLLMESLFSMA
ncbi:hypothetical protein PR048_011275 [Dryococelus australis]|uniref:Uncharacterized protein n=1 Tax=Dryococelus australis TaxID=614101 RepID=A0ABQ9HL49_9NEOP|nr:hypothetical protein PR048_011275 [Dryococelus australis]